MTQKAYFYEYCVLNKPFSYIKRRFDFVWRSSAASRGFSKISAVSRHIVSGSIFGKICRAASTTVPWNCFYASIAVNVFLRLGRGARDRLKHFFFRCAVYKVYLRFKNSLSGVFSKSAILSFIISVLTAVFLGIAVKNDVKAQEWFMRIILLVIAYGWASVYFMPAGLKDSCFLCRFFRKGRRFLAAK